MVPEALRLTIRLDGKRVGRLRVAVLLITYSPPDKLAQLMQLGPMSLHTQECMSQNTKVPHRGCVEGEHLAFRTGS